MCGHVGIAGDMNGTHDKILKTLLILDSLRGEDSTGVAFVSKFTGTVSVAKQLGDPFNLFQDNKFENNMKKLNKVFIGHNRYATSGGVSKTGAHPFEFDTLVGAHNGTLGSKFRLEDHNDFKVDSQALYHNIEKNGLKAAIAPLGAVGNSWSLVWWDKIEQTINFLRNKERPLWMARTEDGNVLFWASEYWMLDVALHRAGIKFGPIFQTEEDTHYSVHIDNKGQMQKPKVSKVEADPVVYAQQYAGSNYRGSPSQTTNTATQKPVQNNVVQLPAPANTATAVTPATSKGVDVSKKETSPFVKHSGLASSGSFLTSKKRVFELLKGQRDGNGAMFISLFDPLEPYIDIRLYPHKTDVFLFDCEGSEIIADVSEYCTADTTALRGYYKVSPWTVSLSGTTLEQVTVEERFADHRGTLITEIEWKEQYSLCSWCSELLDPINRNRFTHGGDCLCPGCSTNSEVLESVNLM